MEEKKRGGRPKKFPEAVKTSYLGFRLPEEEIRVIEASATEAGESVSQYVREAIILRRGIPYAGWGTTSHSVQLQSNGKLTVCYQGSLFELSEQDYAFIQSVVECVKRYTLK